MSDEESGDEYGDAEYQVGSICRLYLKNFMQYGECEMRPGPTLNVILGPNGSGKSSVVNGLALALGSKTNVLGRAEDVKDFIRTGCDSAELEVELKGPQRNIVIGRKWDHANRTIWTINRKRTTQKEIVSVVKGLNIQTDNLCQFLPQDKVHDFSKMNNKELLAKTVEAVARQELKDDHESLKALQKEIHEKEERFRNKNNNLVQMKNRVANLERDVKNFEEKNQIESQMALIKLRMRWSHVREALVSVARVKKERDDTQATIRKMEEELKPLADAVKAKEREQRTVESDVKREEEAYKASDSSAKGKKNRFEVIREEADGLDVQILQAQDQLEERNEHIKLLDAEIARMKRECEQETGDLSDELQEQLRVLKAEIAKMSTNHQNLISEKSDKDYEKRGIENRIMRGREELSQLTSVDQQKKEILVTLPQGRDTSKALNWLDNNRQNFRGQIYNPIMLQMNVENEDNAIYLENVVPLRDLVAFGAESADDMNALLNEFRQGQRLQTNAFQVDPNGNPDQAFPSPDPSFPAQFGFIGYLSDMFTAPAPVKHYLCKQYKLHTIPVFEKKAERFLEQLANNYGLKIFFVGHQRLSCMKSRYSGNISTASNKVENRGILKVSVDKLRAKSIQDFLAKEEDSHTRIAGEIREYNERINVSGKDLEAKRQEAKAITQRLNYKQTLMAKVQLKEREKANFIRQNPGVDVEGIRRQVEAQKTRIAKDMVKLNEEIAKLVTDGVKCKMNVSLLKFKIMPILDELDAARREHGEKERGLEPEKIQLGEQEETLRRVKDTYRERLAKARQESSAVEGVGQWKGDSAPPELEARFKAAELVDKEGKPIDSNECKQRWHQLENQLQIIDEVDPELIEEHTKLRNDVASMEQDLERWEADFAEKKEQMEVIRVRWMARLTELVAAISEGFSGFFATMGFAGEVKLGHGPDPNDFHSYGIEVFVKFRENVDMQKLDPFQQSGGERSVSTALYMLALQHLTKVPFRCVDEINQGMDARNERRVFDMLIETAVRKNTAQYFLLTPKLLPDLNYDRGVTVLTVYNGDQMCEYPQWKNDDFCTQEETFSQQFSQQVGLA